MKTYRSTCLALLIAGLLSPLAPVYADPAADREFQARLNQAMQGDADAQYRVGEMYEQGIGIGKDPAMAYLWYNKAANSGNARAKDKLTAAEKVDVNEQSRVNGAMRALQQQSVDQDVAKQKAAVDARRVQQDEAARVAREKAAAAAAATAAAEAAARARAEAAAKARADAAAKAASQTAAAKQPPKPIEPPKPAPAVVAAPAAVAKPAPAPAPAPKTAEADKDEFKANPCKGPQAKFMSTCN